METNYYIRKNECEKCGRHDDVHIGKNGYGRKFCFQYNRGVYYKNIEEMKKWLKDKQIWDEYGKKISDTDFWKMVENEQNGELDNFCLNIGGYNFIDVEFH